MNFVLRSFKENGNMENRYHIHEFYNKSLFEFYWMGWVFSKKYYSMKWLWLKIEQKNSLKPKTKAIIENFFQLNDNILGLLAKLVRFAIFFLGQWLVASISRMTCIYLVRSSLMALLQTSDQSHLLIMENLLVCLPKGSKFPSRHHLLFP